MSEEYRKAFMRPSGIIRESSDAMQLATKNSSIVARIRNMIDMKTVNQIPSGDVCR